MDSIRKRYEALGTGDEQLEDVTIDTERGGKLVISRRPKSTIAISDDGRIWAEARYPHAIIWTAENGERGHVWQDETTRPPRGNLPPIGWVRFLVDMPQELRENLRQRAIQEKRSASEIVRTLLAEYLQSGANGGT